MKLFAVRSLKLKNSLIIVGVMVPLLIGFFTFDLFRQTNAMRTALTDRGIILAITGAETGGKVLSDAVKYNLLTETQLFDRSYLPIPGTTPTKYRTAYDWFTDENLRGIEDAFLKDKVIVYAVAVDINDYVPTHNTIFSQSSGELSTDRSKRIFDDSVGLAAARNEQPYLFQEYRRDTGEVMWDISSPIYVNGRHWGAFRIGFSIDETNKQIAVIRNQIIGTGALLIAVLIVLALYISHLISIPVKRLEEEVHLIAQGDFTVRKLATTSEDEVGNLVRSFANMVDKLRGLTERTRQTAGLIATYTAELQNSTEQAASSVGVAADKTVHMTKLVKKIETDAAVIISASASATTNLLKAESISEKFLKQMESSNVVMSGASESINELESSVEKIGDIIQFIVLIADQADLLAKKAVSTTYNERGSDFTALAAEIQKRAQDAAKATRGISGLFKSVQEHAHQASITLEKDQKTVLEGFNVARETLQLFKPIVTDLQNLTKTVKEVVAYTQQVSGGILNVNTISEEQSALLKRFTGATAALDDVVRELQLIFSTFRL